MQAVRDCLKRLAHLFLTGYEAYFIYESQGARPCPPAIPYRFAEIVDATFDTAHSSEPVAGLAFVITSCRVDDDALSCTAEKNSWGGNAWIVVPTKSTACIHCGLLLASGAAILTESRYSPLGNPVGSAVMVMLPEVSRVAVPLSGEMESQLASSVADQFNVPLPKLRMLSIRLAGLAPPAVA